MSSPLRPLPALPAGRETSHEISPTPMRSKSANARVAHAPSPAGASDRAGTHSDRDSRAQFRVSSSGKTPSRPPTQRNAPLAERSAPAQQHSASNGQQNARVGQSRRTNRGGKGTWQSDAQKDPDPILFQTYFKSVGPRTYATQLKRAPNGNQYLVFTEGKRDSVTGEVRKTRLYLYSEDFANFFKMLKETAQYLRENPVPAEIVQKRSRYWEKQKSKPSRQHSSMVKG